LLPYVTGWKRRIVCTVVLLLALAPEFSSAHLHVEPAPIVPSVVSALSASGGNLTAQMVSSSWPSGSEHGC